MKIIISINDKQETLTQITGEKRRKKKRGERQKKGEKISTFLPSNNLFLAI